MKKRFKKIISLILVICFVFSYMPQVFAFVKAAAPEPTMTPLQDLRKNQAQEEEKEEEVYEELTPEEQEILDEINNNAITVTPIGTQTATNATVNSTDKLKETEEDPISALPAELQEAELKMLAATSSISTVTDEGFKVEPVASVYNVLNNNNDYVSQATGALTYEKTLLSLPGANGLDLNLSVRYNSDDAVITQNQFIDTSDHVRNINFNNFAIGWSFGFPAIVKKEIEKSYGWDRETSLVFPDGSSYKIKDDVENLTTDKELDLQYYRLSDMKLIKKADTNNYELTYTNGTIYTFENIYGNLIQIKDRFGNEINFNYSEYDYSQGSFWDYMFNFSYYKAKINALTEIVDSAGRIVKFEYDFKNTLNGKQLKKVEINLNDTTYATLNFERRTTYGGPVDVLSQIIDSEGYATKLSYDEKAAFIYNSNYDEPTYTLNGSMLALTRLDLPTGGWVKYDYTKARRTYLYYDGSLNADWHEVYKVSKVSDSSGYERTYEYENDRSGYPYSRLSADPIVYEGYTYNQETTGYVVDNDFTYSCIMREKRKTTVTTFDYMHNKIEEYTYNENNTQNNYVSGNGQTKWNALVGNYIYCMGYSDEVNKKTYFYKQHTGTGETELLTPYDGKIYPEDVMKTSGSKIYVFSKSDSLYALEYDTTTDTWADGGSYSLSSAILDIFSFDSILYKDNSFYIRGVRGSYVYYARYSATVNKDFNWNCWQRPLTESGNNSTLKYLFTFDIFDYYYDGNNIYEYNIKTSLYTSKTVGPVVSNGGFETEGRMFMFNDTYITEFDYADETVLEDEVYYFSDSPTISQYLVNGTLDSSAYSIQKDINGYAYFIMNDKGTDGLKNIYRFEPFNEEDRFVYVGSRIIHNNNYTILSVGTTSRPEFYILSDGIEKMKLYTPTSMQSTSVVTTEYNSYNQPITKTITRISGSQRKETGTESYTYVDKKSNVLSSTDIAGNKTIYVYDSTYYLPTKVTHYADTSNAIVTDYELTGDKKSVETATVTYDDASLKTVYEYNDTNKPGNVTSEFLYQKSAGESDYTLANSKAYTYTEGSSLVGSITQNSIKTNDDSFVLSDGESITVSYTYNDKGILETETDSLGRTRGYYYLNNGLPWDIYYTNDAWKSYYYYINGHKNGENIIENTYYHIATLDDGLEDAVPGYTVINYLDDLGRVIMQTESPKEGGETILSTYKYTGHNISKVTDGEGNYTLYYYDEFDRIKYINQYDKNNNPIGTTTITYDDFNLTRTVNNSGKISKTYYDKLGRVIKEEVQTDAGLAVTQTEYDYMGNVVKTISPKGEETSYSYNDRGLLTSVLNPAQDVTSYTYDALGNNLSVTHQDKLIQRNTYDSLNRVLTTTDAMGYNNKYQYDKGGRVVKSLDKKGQITTYEYKPDTDYLESQTAGNNVTSYTYDPWGNMLSATNNTGTYNYTYKFNNLLESVTTPDNKTISYTYDNNHNVSQVTDYTGDIVNYTYDGLNKVDTISRNNTLVADYDYYNFGALQKITYPNQGSSEFTYDNALRLTSQTNKLADNTVTNAYTYTYDKNGNQLTKTDNGSTTSYVYDNLNQLTRTTDPDGTVTQYGIDVQGNIEVKIVTYPEPRDYTYIMHDQECTVNDVIEEEIWYTHNNNNELTQETISLHIDGQEDTFNLTKSYYYDENGNMTCKAFYPGNDDSDPDYDDYFYNELNQLVSYETGKITTYTYTPDGMMRSKETNDVETTFYWDRGYMSAESVNGTFTAKNYIGAQGIFARESGNNTEYMLKNGHGDVTNIINNGTVSNYLDYDPYGNQTMGNTTNPFRYCGEYFDEESGLIYLRNRYYNPEIGRFMTEDTIQDGLNWYAYCGNNPVNFVDPSGLRVKGDIPLGFGMGTNSLDTAESQDVKLIQLQLQNLTDENGTPYLSPDITTYGYFGSKTLAAVNAYKNDMGLGNEGVYAGLVGDETWEWLGLDFSERNEQTSVWPVGGNGGTISAGYPYYPSGRRHDGIDIAATSGLPVYSAYSGTVITSKAVKNSKGAYISYGNFVVIQSQVNGNVVNIYYCHMLNRNVSAGTTVYAGDKIGEVGSTGNSTGPHLHFEVRINGKVVNPTPYLPN